MKRVVLYRFHRQPADGLIQPESFLSNGESLEFLTVSGAMQAIPAREIKALCFVSEPGRADLFLACTQFERRPKAAGLWTRFKLLDGDELDGLLPQNLSEWPATGFLLIPPHAGASRQRVFLPRTAVRSADAIGLIGAAKPQAADKRRRTGIDEQLRMFDQ